MYPVLERVKWHQTMLENAPRATKEPQQKTIYHSRGFIYLADVIKILLRMLYTDNINRLLEDWIVLRWSRNTIKEKIL